MPGSDEPKKNESAEPAKPSHTLADHTYGIDLAHTHDGYADHDHDFPDDCRWKRTRSGSPTTSR